VSLNPTADLRNLYLSAGNPPEKRLNFIRGRQVLPVELQHYVCRDQRDPLVSIQKRVELNQTVDQDGSLVK